MIIRVRTQAMPNEKENIFSRELADPRLEPGRVEEKIG